MVTRRKPKTTQNSPAVKTDEVVEKTSAVETTDKTSAPAPEKKQPATTKKEPEPKVHIGRRVWPD